MRCCLIVVLVASGLLARADAPGDEFAALVAGLNADSRTERLDALGRIEKIGDLPEPLVKPVLAFVRREVEVATAQSTIGEHAAGEPLPGELLRGDEASLTALGQKPATADGPEFVLCGRLTVRRSNDNALQTQEGVDHAFDLEPLTPVGDTGPGHSIRVVIPAMLGRGLAADVARASARLSNPGLLVRLHCTINRGRLARAGGNALEAVEVRDWHYFDIERRTWAPSAFEGMKRGMAVVRTANRSAVLGLVATVVSADDAPDSTARDLMKGAAFKTLLSLSEDARRDAIERLRAALPSVKEARARRWVSNVARALETTVDARRPADVPAQDRSTVEQRAASALRIASNLEKSGKLTAALKQYAEVMSSYAGTPQASAAAQRVKALKEATRSQ